MLVSDLCYSMDECRICSLYFKCKAWKVNRFFNVGLSHVFLLYCDEYLPILNLNFTFGITLDHLLLSTYLKPSGNGCSLTTCLMDFPKTCHVTIIAKCWGWGIFYGTKTAIDNNNISFQALVKRLSGLSQPILNS